ncbi:MAG: Rieske 2Fe-2S domain-containing protein [Nitrososphaerales archaeon]|nr:Rieske 2Fe-2S domain-containing protein [Nitrososphaerales archaeon]
MSSDESDAGGEGRGKGRRNFLKAAVVVGVFAALGAVSSVFRLLEYVPPPSVGATTQQLAWPRVRVVNVKSLGVERPLRFNYPLVDTANIMVKLGVNAENGVGPGGDIVAYSAVCQHLGCFYSFVAPGSSPPCSSKEVQVPEGYCCCHGGEYDFANGARVIAGPPPRPVPLVRLEYDQASGDIYAVGMGPPTIFGRGPPGTTDPDLVLKHDLEGGELVTEKTVISLVPSGG